MLKNYKDILSVEDLCDILSIGKNTAYRLLKSGEKKALRIGKEYKKPKKSITDYIKGK